MLSGTALEPAEAAPAWQVLLAKTLSGLLPTFSLRVRLDGSTLSRDGQVARAYEEDLLVHWLRSVRWGAESLQVIEWVKARPGDIRLPVLFLHGENDRLVRASGAQLFYDQIQYPDKAIRIYPGGLHEPHNDLQHKQVVDDVAQWLAAHI